MNITYFTANYGYISETFVSDLINGLSLKNNVTIICNQVNNNKFIHSDSIKVEEIRFLALQSLLDRFQFRLSNFSVQQSHYYQFFLLQKHAYRCLKPIVKSLEPDVAYIDFGSVAVMVQQVLKELAIPFVVHFHGSDISSALNNPAYRQALQYVFLNASALIVPSHHLRRLLVLEGAPPQKIHVVRHGVNLEGLTPKPWNERKLLPPSIVFLGRFTPKKNPIALIQAFALVRQKIPNACLTMIGDGSEMSKAQEVIEKLQLSHCVNLYGSLPRSQALPIVNQHWVFVQHSVTPYSGDQEGFPVVLIEAAALEMPIVATFHSGITEQVIQGKTGFLVQEFNYEEMADRIIELLANPNLAEKMGKLGRENISQICRIEERANNINNLLLLASQKPK